MAADELRHGLGLTEPKLVIADAPRAKRLEATGLGIADRRPLPVEKPLAEALAPLLEAAARSTLPEVAPEDDATILFTSGSTGAAKGAVSTHRAVTTGIYTYSLSLLALLGIMESEGEPPANPPRTLVNVPLFHVTGEVPVLLNSFVIGRGMVLMAKWDAGEALRLIEKEKVTYFVGVPTMSLELMQHPDRDKYDLSSLTDIAAGGAPRPVAHVEAAAGKLPGAQPALGYGLTETNAVGCGNFWQNYADKPASTGRPHKPIVELAILGEGDRHLPPGERGEIAIRSAANFRGYWRDPGGDRGRLHRRRLFPDRRHRLSRRGRLSVHRRPQEGHHHPRRREYQLPGGGGRALSHISGVGSLRVRSARRAARRGAGGGRLLRGRPRRSTRRRCATSSTSGSPRTRSRRISGSTTSRCPSSAPARSTRWRCGSAIGGGGAERLSRSRETGILASDGSLAGVSALASSFAGPSSPASGRGASPSPPPLSALHGARRRDAGASAGGPC